MANQMSTIAQYYIAWNIKRFIGSTMAQVMSLYQFHIY